MILGYVCFYNIKTSTRFYYQIRSYNFEIMPIAAYSNTHPRR